MQQILESVNYCHEHGIVHRDLKVSLNSVLDGLYHFISISVVCHYTYLQIYNDIYIRLKKKVGLKTFKSQISLCKDGFVYTLYM